MTQPVYIYALINPVTSLVFYVGASKFPNARLYQHIYEKKLAPSTEMIILEECELSEVNFLEEFYVDLFSFYGFKLINKQKVSGYTVVSNHSPKFIKKEGKKLTTFILRWMINGGTSDIKMQVPNNSITEQEAKTILFEDYNSLLQPQP